MNKINLYIGLNDKDKKIQLINTLEAYKIVSNVLLNNYEGCTIYECDGIYKHNNGNIVIEKSLKCEMLVDNIDNNKLNNVINTLKVALNQESIMQQLETISDLKFV